MGPSQNENSNTVPFRNIADRNKHNENANHREPWDHIINQKKFIKQGYFPFLIKRIEVIKRKNKPQSYYVNIEIDAMGKLKKKFKIGLGSQDFFNMGIFLLIALNFQYILSVTADCLLRNAVPPYSCLLCNFTDYSIDDLNKSISENRQCTQRLLYGNYSKTVFIKNESNNILENRGSQGNPYSSLSEAFRIESYQSAPFREAFIRIFLMSDVLFYEEPEGDYNYFKGVNISLTISPAFCSEFPGLLNCIPEEKKSTIFFKTSKISIFIMNSLSIKNIIIDGRDIWSNSTCRKSPVLCCPSFERNSDMSFKNFPCINNEGNLYPNFDIDFVQGIFNLEAFLGPYGIISNSALEMKDIELNNLMIGNNSIKNSFIRAWNFASVSIKITNMAVRNCFFSGGIFFFADEVESISEPQIEDFLKQRRTVNILQSMSSLVNIQALLITYYIDIFNGSFLFKKYSSPLVFLQGYKGNFSLRNSLFTYIDMGPKLELVALNSVFYFDDSNGDDALSSVENKKIIEVFNLTIKDSKSLNLLQALRSRLLSISPLISVSVDLSRNYFREAFYTINISEFRVKTNYRGFAPLNCFICFEYSTVVLYDSEFSEITKNPDSTDLTPVIFKSNSAYQISIIDQFNTYIDKNQRLAIDEIFILSVKVLNTTAMFNLIMNTNSVYNVFINNSLFSQVNIGLARFIRLSVEKLFSVINTTFIGIQCENHFILIEPGYQYEMINVKISQILIRDGAIAQLKSFTKYRETHTFKLINVTVDTVSFSITNLPLFLVSSEGSKVFLFSSRYETSGYGANVLIRNSSFTNIFVKEPYDNMYFLFLACGKFALESDSFTNVSNSMIVYYLATIIDGSASLINILADLTSVPIYKFFKSSTEFFDTAKILNVFIQSSVVLDSSLFQISNVVNFQMKNSSLKGASLGGSLLLVGVRELQYFYCQNVSFEGDLSLTRKTGGLSFQTQVNTFPTSYLYGTNISNIQAGISNCTFLNLDNSAIKTYQNTQLVIRNVIIMNVLSEYGGGIRAQVLSQVLALDILSFNLFAYVSGGFIYTENSLITMKNSVISTTKSLGLGGAIMCLGSNIAISNIKFNETAAKVGGTISMENSDFTIDTCSFSFGSGEMRGGFISGLSGNLIVLKSEFTQGKTYAKGACFNLEGTRVKVVDAIFQSSFASKIGILIIIGAENVIAVLVNVKFNENVALNCPTLVLHNLNVFMYNLTFLNNTADENLLEIYQSFAITCIFFQKVSFVLNNAQKALIDATLHIIVISEGKFINNVARNHLKSASSQYIILKMVDLISKNEDDVNINKVISERIYFIEVKSKILILEDTMLQGRGNHGGLSGKFCDLILLKKTTIQSTIGITGSAISLQKTNLILESTLIYSCAGLENAVVTSLNSNSIYLVNSAFQSNYLASNKEGVSTDIYLNSYESTNNLMKVFSFNTSFWNISKKSIALTNSDIFMGNTIFFGQIKMGTSQAINIKDTAHMELRSVLAFHVHQLGAIIIENTKLRPTNPFLLLTNSTFFHCNSIYSGAALSINGLINVSINNCHFMNSSSDVDGGAINYDCPQTYSSCNLNLAGTNFFINNTALKRGGAIFIASQNDKMVNDDIYIENNKALVGQDFASSPKEIIMIRGLNKSEIKKYRDYFQTSEVAITRHIPDIDRLYNLAITDRIELVVGKPIELAFFLVDQYDNIIVDLNLIGFHINLLLDNPEANPLNAVVINNYALIENGIGYFESLTITCENRTDKLTASISASGTTGIIASIKKEIPFSLAPCNPGDVFIDNFCIKCPPGSYSLDDNAIETQNSICLSCPENAICWGGNSVEPGAGYWRKGNHSSIIVKCPNEEACPSRNLSDLVYDDDICGGGYEGDFCGYCKIGYTMLSSQCEECSSINYYTGILIPYFLFFSFTLMAQKDVNANQKSTEKRLLTNTLSNHFSNLMIISMFDLNWNVDINNVIDIFNVYINPSSQNVFSFGCIFAQGGDTLQRLTLIVVIVSPPIFVMIFLLLRELVLIIMKFYGRIFRRKNSNQEVSAFKSKKIFKQMMRLAFLLIFFNMYPTLMFSLIKVLDCIEIEPNIGVMKISPDIDCSTNDYIYYELISGLSLICWGLGIPLVLFFIARNSTKRHINNKVKTKYMSKINPESVTITTSSPSNEVSINNTDNRNEFDSGLGRFLTLGYKKKFYYWESIIYLRKLFIILVSLLSNYLHVMSISGLVIIVFFVLFLFNMKADIFASTKVQNMETLSLIAAILTLSFGLLVRKENYIQELNMLFLILVLLTNIVFFCFWVRTYVSMEYEEIKRIFSPKKNRIQTKRKKTLTIK